MFLFVRDVCLLWEEGDLGNYTSIWVSFVCDVLFFFWFFFLKNIIRSYPGLILGSLQ